MATKKVTDPLESEVVTSDVSQTETLAVPLSKTMVYAGPTMHRRVIIGGSVYKGGIPAHILKLVEKVPDVGSMIVPLKDFAAVRAEANTQGTEYHRLYNALLAVRFDGEEVRT